MARPSKAPVQARPLATAAAFFAGHAAATALSIAGALILTLAAGAMFGLGLNKILGTLHADRTLAEADQRGVGEWERAQARQKPLQWVVRFHAWERS